jgi:hypothetical protein
MDFAKGIAVGFVIGVAVIGTAVATLYIHDDSVHERNTARIDDIDAHVQRLERAVATLSGRMAEEKPAGALPTSPPTAMTSLATSRDSD